MNIEYKDKDVEISIKNVSNDIDKEDYEYVIKIIELFKGFGTPLRETLLPVAKQIQETEAPKQLSNDRPVIRGRLPNQIDLSELEIKQAVTSEPMIRCPHCAQASKAIVRISDTENYLLRKVNKNNKETFETVVQLEDDDAITKICKPLSSDITDYHNDIMKIRVSAKLRNTDLNVGNDTLIQCPVCSQTHKFSEWVEAFKHPLDFGFETENLCDVCGHETIEVLNPDKNGKRKMRCESCGYEKNVSE